MNRDTFAGRHNEAAIRAVRFARGHVRQQLPDTTVFRVCPNRSYDGNPLVADEETFPADDLPEEGSHGPWATAEAVAFLWRAGKVPEWVDVMVIVEDGAHTVVELWCCGRFTATDQLLYHQTGGIPPFAVKSPYLPPGWESGFGPFDLYWRTGPVIDGRSAS